MDKGRIAQVQKPTRLHPWDRCLRHLFPPRSNARRNPILRIMLKDLRTHTEDEIGNRVGGTVQLSPRDAVDFSVVSVLCHFTDQV